MTYLVAHRQADAPRLYGAARDFWAHKGPEVILSGPYETGKTFAALHKLDALLWKYPGAQALMVRQTYKSLLASACQTLEHKVMVAPPDDPGSPIQKYGGSKPEFYIYPNGSRIWLGGLDSPDKFLSAEFDLIYINQAEEITRAAYEKLTGRATGRAGNMPYTQVMADCNPGPPEHWILARAQTGRLKLLEQRHEHNPVLFDPATGERTSQGERTLATLDALTGLEYQRGRLGKWVLAEGAVYDNFSFADTVTEAAGYTPDLPVYWGVDNGYAHGDGPGTPGYHPRVILWLQQQPDGAVTVFDELVVTQELPEATIAAALARPYPHPALASVDSSAVELRRRLAEAGVRNVGATHRVADGIQVVRRFIGDGQGVRQLHVHPRCTTLIRELQSYRYDDRARTVEGGERKPLKLDDHAADALRYALWQWR